MTIEDLYPSPLEFFKIELETFNFIRTRHKLFASAYPYLIANCSTMYEKLNAAVRKEIAQRIDLFTECKIILDHNYKNTGRALLGIDIACDGGFYNQVSYSLTICKRMGENDNDRMLRKYHFDYTSAEGTNKHHNHPVFHLQYAGKLSTHHIKLNLDHDHITCDSWLSEPRISVTPVSFALLLNLVFKEFPDDDNRRIIETSEWRKLIKTNERHFLKPYFDLCYTFLNRSHKFLLTNDFLYGQKV